MALNHAAREELRLIDEIKLIRQELESFYARTLERIEKATLILMSRDPHPAEEFIREKEQINIQFRSSRKARLERSLTVQNAASNIVDMINCLRRINSQLTSLAYAIVRESIRPGMAVGREPDLGDQEVALRGGGPGEEERRS